MTSGGNSKPHALLKKYGNLLLYTIVVHNYKTSMKKHIIKVMFILFVNSQCGQSQIEYGSNQGKYIVVDSTKIYYEEYGDGHPVILLHGGMGSISNFGKVIPDLSKHFKLILIDSPNHGRSHSIDSLSYNILAEYVVKIITELKLNKLDIIGHSDGAIVGMLVAEKIPGKINKLVFGGGSLNPGASTPLGLKFLHDISPDKISKEWVDSYKKKSPDPNDWEKFIYNSKKMWLQDTWIPLEILPRIKSKVLVLSGDRDQFIPVKHTVDIYSALPDSELCILPNTYHDIFNNPKTTNPILINFLSKN